MNTVENVFKILEEAGVDYKRSEHEPVKTSEEASKIRGVALNTGVKALLLRERKQNIEPGKTGFHQNRFVIVLVPADKKVDMEKIAELEKAKKAVLATPQEVLEETGCDIGGVPPFGHTKNSQPNQIKTYMDRGILKIQTVNFNAGSRTVSVSMKGEDLGKIVNYIGF